MKYCNNCKKNQKSWAESLGDYNKYSDNRCWECNEFTLELIRMTYTEVSRELGCNMSGGYTCKTTYTNSDGSSTTTYFSNLSKANSGIIECKIEVPPRPSSPCVIS